MSLVWTKLPAVVVREFETRLAQLSLIGPLEPFQYASAHHPILGILGQEIERFGSFE
jgi:hypothetical protein